jgi:hypothetical protein
MGFKLGHCKAILLGRKDSPLLGHTIKLPYRATAVSKRNEKKSIVYGFDWIYWNSCKQTSVTLYMSTFRYRGTWKLVKYITTAYEQDGQGSTPSILALGSPSFLSYGYWGLFPQGIRQPGSKDDQLPLSNAEIKWSSTCISQYILMAWCLIN